MFCYELAVSKYIIKNGDKNIYLGIDEFVHKDLQDGEKIRNE